MRVGLLGAVLMNENLGCVALSYSIVKVIHEINPNAEIIIYEPAISEESISLMRKELVIEREKLDNKRLSYIGRNFIKKIVTQRFFKKDLKNLDLVFDITEGDSFTDIYGQKRFNGILRMKKDVIEAGVPLILAPQTYGPFKDSENLREAMNVINQSALVITRDIVSKEFIQASLDREIELTTDLAFSLPYETSKKFSDNGIKTMGLNVSGLLWGDFETGTQKNFQLKADYQKVIKAIIDYLIVDGWEIHLIAHVIGPDMEAIEVIASNYENVIVAPAFQTPVAAKSYISKLDLFIGSRMHATIASLSSQVPTIPLSYSRKFSGLFNSLNYCHDISLESSKTEAVIQEVIFKIENLDVLQEDMKVSNKIIEEKTKHLADILKIVLN